MFHNFPTTIQFTALKKMVTFWETVQNKSECAERIDKSLFCIDKPLFCIDKWKHVFFLDSLPKCNHLLTNTSNKRLKKITNDLAKKFADNNYQVMFYRTQHVKSDGITTQDECTFLLFVNGILKEIGLGEKYPENWAIIADHQNQPTIDTTID